MINRAKMPRQLRNKGGITNVVPREKYGIGSDLKKFVRKLIPNELASVAVKAAPFVAPFNPAIAGLMRGIGRFDQRGSLSDAFKQGIATAGLGVGARALGGATDIMGGGIRSGLTSPLSPDRTTAVKDFFTKKDPLAEEMSEVSLSPSTKGTEGTGLNIRKSIKDATGLFKDTPILKDLPSLVKQQILVGGVSGALTYIYQAFLAEEPPQQEGETYEEYMARRKENVGRKMKGYFDNYFKFDKEYSSMTDEQKQAFIDRVNVRDGGRIGYQTGGITMANTLAENIRRNLANQAAFQQAINPSKQKIVERLQKANPTTKSALEKFADHARVSEAMKGKTGMDVIPEYALQTGADFQTKFPGVNPKVSAGLAAAYQTLQEGARALNPLNPDKFLRFPTALKTAQEQASKNIEGILAADSGNLTAKQIEDRNKYLKQQGQMEEPVMMAETPKKDPTGYNFDSEYYRKNPGSKDFDRFKVAYAKSLGMDDKISVSSDGQVYVDFGNFDPSRTYQAYKQNKQTNYDRPFFYRSPTLSPERTAELEKQENILTSLYGAPGKGRASVAKGGMPVGIMKTNKAGVMERDYRETGGFVPVGIKEKADDVPAMLSKNEFVFTADAVRGAGNGSIEKGAQRMYDTMKKLEKRVV